MLYVAISRTRQKSFVNFCDVDCKLQEGYIYKIANKRTNKLYIGNNKTIIEQRYQEHIKSLDGSPLHSGIQELGYKNQNKTSRNDSVHR